MILRWGYKTLVMQKAATMASMAGIAFSFLLALFFAAVWQGETQQIVAYPKRMNPDLWVMQDGVSNMHMASSFVWDWKGEAIAKLPEVEQVTGFLYLNTVIQVQDNKLFGFVVGLSDGQDRAGPWALSEGRHLQNPEEIIVPDTLRSVFGLGQGDTVRIVDKDYRVVGFSKGTYSSANPVFFVLKDRLQDSLSSDGTLSYYLVDAKQNVDIKALQQKILAEIDNVNVVTQAEFIANDYEMATQMGAETILIMTLICSTLAALIIGYACYSLAIKKRKELAIIKAVGGKDYQLVIVVLLQSISVTLLAYVLAIILLVLLSVAMPLLAPQITVALTPSLILKPTPFALFIAIIGSVYPAIKLLRLDPAMAYKNG